jgi:hypothetical protein
MTEMKPFTIHAGPRRGRALLASASLLLAALAAGPAAAQWFGGPPGPFVYNRPPPVFRGNDRPLPPYVVVDRLEAQGYEDVGRPRYNGSVYEVEATGLSGARVRVVVDAFRGHVVDRYAISRAPRGPDFGPGGWRNEDRGWFGNNVRPPEEAPPPRRYTNRPGPDDDLQDFLDRPARPVEPRLGPETRIETAPLPDARIETRPSQPPRSADLPRSPDLPGERQAARPAEPATPALRPQESAPAGKVEGLNPETGKAPEAAKPAAPRHERASRPEPNRQYEAARTDAKGSKPAKPAPQEGSAAVSPPAPAPAVTPQATPPAEKPAVTAEKPAEKPAADAAPRPDKPVRVIQGVTPMNPETATPKP